MMILDLPSDVIEDILFRVPATSLGISRLTCKSWNVLVKDPNFIQKYFHKTAARQFLVVVLMDFRVYSMSVDLQRIYNNVDPCVEFPRKLNLIDSHRNSEKVDISEVFHCDGSLLCITNDKRLLVWNPCTGQTIRLNPRKPYDICDRYALGYANNNMCRSYKILRSFPNFPGRMEIFEFSSNSWRALDYDVKPNCLVQSRGVSLKGNTYWLALSKNYMIEANYCLLLSFDFATERYQRLSLPFQNSVYDTKVLSVVRGEQLSVLNWRRDTQEMEIWVSTKIQTTNVSWSNFLKVALDNIPYRSFSDDASFFIEDDKKIAVCCDRYSGYIIGEEENKFREISLDESTDLFGSPIMFNYVPSFVQIQQGQVTSGGKRKERA